jgi:hypothetical protein
VICVDGFAVTIDVKNRNRIDCQMWSRLPGESTLDGAASQVDCGRDATMDQRRVDSLRGLFPETFGVALCP